MDRKTCTSCREDKSVSMFYKDRHLKSGLQSSCKNCVDARKHAWKAKNPKKFAETQKRYRDNNIEKMAKRQKEHYQENREALVEKRREYVENNKDKVHARNMDYYYKNRDVILKARKPYQKKWRQENLEKNAMATARRRSLRRNRVLGGKYTELDELVLSEAHIAAKERTKEFGFPWHVDHMIPLAGKIASGLDCAWNIQVIPAYLNTSKRNKHIMTEPLEWLRYI